MAMKKAIALLVSLIMLCSMAYAGESNELVQVILSAGTTQAFSSEAVSEEDLNSIVQAGLAAASAINQQPWYFAVITNAEMMAELSSGGGMPAGFTAPAGDGMEASSGAPAGDVSSAAPAGDGMEASSGMPAAPASTGAAKAALGDSPVAIVIYMNENTSSPNASFDCGLACQNMVIAASALGYGTKIISSPTMTLNGADHDAICEKLGVDPAYQAVAVLLIGVADAEAELTASASVRNTVEDMVSFVK